MDLILSVGSSFFVSLVTVLMFDTLNNPGHKALIMMGVVYLLLSLTMLFIVYHFYKNYMIKVSFYTIDIEAVEELFR